MSNGRKGIRNVILLLAAGGLAYGLWGPVSVLITAKQRGFLDTPQQREWDATVDKNLKALYTAMMLTHDSDGQFPAADHWLDAIEARIRTSDMSEDEAEKKKHDPSVAHKPNEFGFAFNTSLAGKYKGDVKNPDTTPLIFQSADLHRNAHGDPANSGAKAPRNHAISVSGKLIRTTP
ncbi:MAG: hypothetical protein JSS72_06230 [Armatimonadetes bacterium]|nr:hypothetical protein [Armatimonadota bacterium]